jgi:hypothetical protein
VVNAEVLNPAAAARSPAVIGPADHRALASWILSGTRPAETATFDLPTRSSEK